jgi:hypothetical protein
MDDFEQAVEDGSLPTFLRQNIDLKSSTTTGQGDTGGDTSMQEAELEKLMREMTDQDLDKLVDELGAEDMKDGMKVGLMVPDGAEAVGAGGLDKSDGGVEGKGKGKEGERELMEKDKKGDVFGKEEADEGEDQVVARKARISMEMMSAGTVDGLLGALEKAEGKVVGPEVIEEGKELPKEKEKVE